MPEITNFTVFCKEKGYCDDYSILDHSALSPSGHASQRTKDRSRLAMQSRLESNAEGHKAFSDAILRGDIVDITGKVTKEGIEKQDQEKEKKEIEDKISQAQKYIDFIFSLGKTAKKSNGEYKKGYALGIKDHENKIEELKKQLEAL